MTGPSWLGWAVITEPGFCGGWWKLLLVNSCCELLLLINTHCCQQNCSASKSNNTHSSYRQTNLLVLALTLALGSSVPPESFTFSILSMYNSVLSCLSFNVSFVYPGQRFVCWDPGSSSASILKWSDRRATTCRWDQSLERMFRENMEAFVSFVCQLCVLLPSDFV